MRWFWLALLALAALGAWLWWSEEDHAELVQPPAPSPESTSPVVPSPGVPSPASTPTPAQPSATQVDRVDARTLRVADRFEIVGAGTERDPYRISWEYLQSAQEGWSAKKGKDALATHITLLDGAWVQIDGYWAPAVVVDKTREVMVMLNRWDGCCLGVPPTPFDSIEVLLSDPIAIDVQHSFRFGTVRGRLEVSPFNLGDIVLGLYRLTDATITSS